MQLQACVFPTKLGWFGLAGTDGCVRRLVIAHRVSDEAWKALRKHFGEDELVKANWHPTLRQRLQDFAAGKKVSFHDFTLHTEHRTEFQQHVLAATQAIGYGEVVSYGELAARVGSPKAARAVGAVMASNEIPILIPCHRVVGSSGKLTGFSAPRGVRLKEEMLAMEAANSSEVLELRRR